jgi:PilZ domain
MLDISERGACIECTVPISKQQPLQVRFSLPGTAATLRFEAVPAWIRGTKIGIQFTSADEESQKALCHWLLRQIQPKTSALELELK